MPDDHSKLVPPLPIPNRTVKRLSADDSAATSVKVGHRQAVIPENPRRQQAPGVFALGDAVRSERFKGLFYMTEQARYTTIPLVRASRQ